jgi:hypothetical protein
MDASLAAAVLLNALILPFLHQDLAPYARIDPGAGFTLNLKHE